MTRFAVAVFLIGLLAGNCCAQVQQTSEPAAGITVQGTAVHKGRPNLAEIDVRVASQAELTSDALTKFQEARKQVIEAIEGLGMKNLEISDQKLAVQPSVNQENDGRPQNIKAKPQIEIGTTLKLTLKGVDKLPVEDLVNAVGKLIDTAQDAGATFGQQPISAGDIEFTGFMGVWQQQQGNTAGVVRFVMSDLAQVREKVYAEAAADARKNAERLARLHQVKLGPVLAVQESSDDQQTAAGGAETSPRTSSATPSEATYRVRLMVRYSIDSSAPAKSGK